MKKRVKKYREKLRKKYVQEALDRTHQLEVETAQLRRALSISEEHGKKLGIMFEQLQAESEAARNELQAEHDAAMEGMKAHADKLYAVIRNSAKTVDKLRSPVWRKWWYRLKGRRESY